MNRDGGRIAGFLWAIAATALWGGTFLGPAAVDPVKPIYLVIGRYSVFGLLSLTVIILNLKTVASLGPRSILAALHLGAFGYFGFYLFFSYAAALGGGPLASIVTGAMPGTVTIASNLMKKEVPWRSLALPIATTSVGLLIVNMRSSATLAGRAPFEILGATLLALVACILWSYFVVVNGVLLKRRRGGGIDNTLWTALIGAGAFFTSLLFFPFVEQGAGPEYDHATLIRFAVVSVLVAILGSWCASWCWNRAAKRLSTVVMGQLIAMETLFGLTFNLIWERRLPSFQEWTGGALVTGGVLFCMYTFERFRKPQLDPDSSMEERGYSRSSATD